MSMNIWRFIQTAIVGAIALFIAESYKQADYSLLTQVFCPAFIGVLVFILLELLPCVLTKVYFVRKQNFGLTEKEGWWINEYTEQTGSEEEDKTKYGLFKVDFNYRDKRHVIRGYAFTDTGVYRAKWKSSSDILEYKKNKARWHYTHDAKFFATDPSKNSVGYTSIAFEGGAGNECYYVDFREDRSDEYISLKAANAQKRKRGFVLTKIPGKLEKLAEAFENSMGKDWNSAVTDNTRTLGKQLIEKFKTSYALR